MKPPRKLTRALLILAVAAGLSGCGMFGWIGSRFSSDKSDNAAAPTPPARSTLGAADPTDPIPRDEPLHPTANKWYGANGRLYRPITDERDFKERGKAAVIDPSFGALDATKSIIAVPMYIACLLLALPFGHHWVMTFALKLFDHLGKLFALVDIRPVRDPYVTD